MTQYVRSTKEWNLANNLIGGSSDLRDSLVRTFRDKLEVYSPETINSLEKVREVLILLDRGLYDH